jgi:hypothetical protein
VLGGRVGLHRLLYRSPRPLASRRLHAAALATPFVKAAATTSGGAVGRRVDRARYILGASRRQASIHDRRSSGVPPANAISMAIQSRPSSRVATAALFKACVRWSSSRSTAARASSSTTAAGVGSTAATEGDFWQLWEAHGLGSLLHLLL